MPRANSFTHLMPLIVVFGCTPEPTTALEACTDHDFELGIVAAPISSDGSAVVSGTLRFAPEATLVGGAAESDNAAGGPNAVERAVHDLYVGSTQVSRTGFNFRSFAVTIPRAQLCSYLDEAGTSSRLPVRVYLYGDDGLCTYDSPTPLAIAVPEGHCSDSAGGGGGR